MKMNCHYSPHSSDSEGAHKHVNDIPQPQEQEQEISDGEPFREDHPPAATSTSTSPEANTALTMSRAAKKQRASYNCSLSTSTQPHQYQYQQKSSSIRGLNEECSSGFARMHEGEAEESSTDKEVGNGKKSNQNYPKEEGDPNPINDTTIMQNPYLPRPSSFSSFLSFASQPSRSHPEHTQHDKHENPDDNPLPLSFAVPYSPMRIQFGDEYYISPKQEQPAPAAHLKNDPLPSAAAVATETEETKMKASSDGGEDSADLPPPLPFLPVKGSCTSTSSQRNAWDRKFNELLDFKQQHGHCDVPQTYVPNPKLGLWVNKQRMEHKNREDGNISTLTDERLDRLQNIGFRWAKRRGQVRWDEKYDELIQYAAKFGNCHVPTKYKENTALGRWVSTQRAEYKKFCKGERSSLTSEKIRRLDSIGFAWFMAL